MTYIKGPFQMIGGYKIEVLHNDEISEILSFFKKEHYQKKGLSKKILNEKKEELNQILKYAWENHKPNRVEAFLDWLYNYSQKWIEKRRPHLSGLEWDFFLKMKKEPFDNYLIIRDDTNLELTSQEQRGLIFSLVCSKKSLEEGCKQCKDKPCLNWIWDNGKKFKDTFEGTYIKKLSKNPYNVYKNPEKALYKILEPKIKEEAQKNNEKIFVWC